MNVLRAEGIQLSEAHYGFSVTNTFTEEEERQYAIIARKKLLNKINKL